MSYHRKGMGDWCSDTHPASGCSPISGVCKPTDAATLDIFKNLQGQLNRVAVQKGWQKIDVDGRLGSKTVDLYNRVTGESLGRCDELASQAAAAAARVFGIANQIGAPAAVPPPITSRPSKALPGGGVVDPPGAGITDAISNTLGPYGLLAVAGAGGFLLWRFLHKKKPAAAAPAVAPAKIGA